MAHAWYRHRFYRFEPDLNTDNPAVREEIQKIAMFWLSARRLRIPDRCRAVPDRAAGPGRPGTADYGFLRDLREALSWQPGDSVMLAEANVSDERVAGVLRAGRRHRYPGADGVRVPPQSGDGAAAGPAGRAARSLPRSASCPICPGTASGPRSCATTTRSTSAG